MAADPAVVSQGAPASPSGAAANPFASLLQLEADVRDAASEKALQFVMANDTRRLLDYRQAYIVDHAGRLVTASSLAVVERNAPVVRWLERVVASLRKHGQHAMVSVVSQASVPPALRDGWNEFAFPFALWCPLVSPAGKPLGGIWLTREQPWTDADLAIVERLRGTYGHAWSALRGGRPPKQRSWGRLVLLAGVAAFVASMFVPVRMSALAPAEIVPTRPTLVAAPQAGTIKEVVPEPDAVVSKGALLFTFEDTDLRNELLIAERRLSVAQASLARARQSAFGDARSRAEIAILQTEVELAEVERDYAQERLDKAEVRAPVDGVLQYTDASDWEGRPVVLGERVMRIADAARAHVRVQLPVEDAVVLVPGAEVRVFLDVDPLSAIDATLRHAKYAATETAAGVLAFEVNADIDPQTPLPRLGLKGTAKVYGPGTTLFVYLFRRPISAARQFLGL